ncbi:MAG: molybdopterin-dependent oxidoreductase [Chloroflexi bacterium]|nr:molybdopterin-dependent oxidoreductase [Chloroflexota bacterium]
MTQARELTIVGQPAPRVEGFEKVTGSAQYVADIPAPGALAGKILRSPYPHARILRIDTARAEALAGVWAVVTAEDTLKRGWGAFVQDQMALATDKVRYVGDEVAAVAAVDEDTARAAIDLIEVSYEELPAVFDTESALADGAPQIHDQYEHNTVITIAVERGDVEKAFAESDVIVEDTFESQHQWHAPLETIGSVAEYSASGKYTIYMNTQTLFMARGRIAWVLGVSEADVRIIQTEVGGGFGGKSCDDNNAIIAALLARKSGRSVRIINTREEEFLAGSRPRVPMRVWVKIGFSRDGHIRAKQMRIVADNGAYSGKAPAIMGVSAFRHETCYKYSDTKTEAYLVYTNKIPTGAFRGFGNPSADWAVEQLLDIGAKALGIDPLELLRLNAIEPGYVSPHGNRVEGCELKQCIDLVEEKMDWKAKWAAKTPGRGVGVACTVHVSGKRHFMDYDGGSATIKMNEDGKVYILSGEGEIGQGASTVFCQIAAEELGVKFSDVSISRADTDLTTFCLGAFGSRLTYVGGNAVKAAAAALKEQLFEAAAEMLETEPGKLTARDGEILDVEAETSVSTATVARARLFRRGGAPLVATGAFDADSVMQDVTRYGNESGAYNFGAQAAEVEVDTETGQVKILSYVSVADCGTVVNPIGAVGQVTGSLAQGIGYALTEHLEFDNGRPVELNYHGYKIPCIADMPPLEYAFADSYEPSGPFGAKGLGELGSDPTAACIGNAIFDAVGIRIKTLPITPEKVLALLREKDAREA